MPRPFPPPADPERVRALLSGSFSQQGSGGAPSSAPGPTEGSGARARSDPSPRPVDRQRPGWRPERPPEPAGGRYGGFDPPAAEADSGPAPAGRHRVAAGEPKVLMLPVALRGARVSVSPRAIGALVVVVVVACGVFAVRVARAEQSSAPVLVASPSGAASGAVVARTTTPAAFASSAAVGAAGAGAASAGAGRSAPDATTAGAAAVAGTGTVTVHVVGQVARPGVLTLPAGARVMDAVRLAGGALPSADASAVNLARILVDGEQIHVPRPGETPTAVPGASAAGSASDAASGSGALVDLNSADAAALDGLPGVGPVLAQRILDWRSQHGRFSTVDELGEVSGIGEKLLDQLRPRVRV